MLTPKPSGTLITALLMIAVLAALTLHSDARAGKPLPNINRPISYKTAPKNSFEIAVIDESGTSAATVIRNESGFTRWSPDGLHLGGYYKWLGSENGLMVATSSGANEQAILTQSQFLAWNLSRPGVLDSRGFEVASSSNCWLGTNAIIFTAATRHEGQQFPEYRLFVVDSSGIIAPLTEAAPHSGRDVDPHFSSAINKVVFATAGDANPELYAISPDGTELQQITDFAGSMHEMRWPVWSPAGDRVLVTVRQGPQTNWQLWILDVDLTQPNPGVGAGGRVTMIDPFKIVDGGGGYVQTAAWSPDGSRIVLSRTVYDNRDRRFFELVVADVETGAETILKHIVSNIELPDWNPIP